MGSAGSAVGEPDYQVGVGVTFVCTACCRFIRVTIPSLFLFMITMPFGPCTNIELRIALSFRVFVFCLVRYRGLNYLNLHAESGEQKRNSPKRIRKIPVIHFTIFSAGSVTLD